MDQVMLRRIKFSTVGIGVHNYTKNEIHLVGSGFYYDTRGYLITAGHVLKSVERINQLLKNRDQKVKNISINLNIVDNDKMTVEEDEIELILYPVNSKYQVDPTRPLIFDIGIGKIKPTRKKYPFLKIRKAQEVTRQEPGELGEAVAICGYPAGEESFSFKIGLYMGFRFSPIMQFGRVASYLPFDDSLHYGIQTDILSTGGSSGSPIVSLATGEVVGVSQKIIPSYVSVKVPEKAQKRVRMPPQLEGYAKVGIVYGDSFNMISDIVNLTKDRFDEHLDITSNAKYTRVFLRPELQQKETRFKEIKSD